MKKSLFLPLVTLALFSSCEKELDYKIPDPGQKVVIDSRIAVGEPITALVSTSTYSMSNNYPQSANDFQVLLYENSTLVDTMNPVNPNFTDDYYYRASNVALGNNAKYRIVASRQGLPTASGEAIMPETVSPEIVSWNKNLNEITFKFEDRPEDGDFYKISVRPDITIGNQPLFFSTLSPEVEQFESFIDFDDESGRRYGYSGYLSDENFNNTTVTVTLRIEEQPIPKLLYIRLEHITESYFRHERTKTAQQYSDGFFSEPVQIYFNVDNGYGIVAGANPAYTFFDTSN